VEIVPHLLRVGKKKLESASDLTDGNIGHYRSYVGRKPTYFEYFGLWLNRKRAEHRRAMPILLGASIALGSINPGDEFFADVSDGPGEAAMMKAAFMMAKGKRS